MCHQSLTIISSNNGLAPTRRQAIIWTNAGILLILTLGASLGEILNKIHAFSFTKMHLETPSVKWWQFCLGLNVLNLKKMENTQFYAVPLPTHSWCLCIKHLSRPPHKVVRSTVTFVLSRSALFLESVDFSSWAKCSVRHLYRPNSAVWCSCM